MLELDESNVSESAYTAVEDSSNVSTNSIQEILEFSQREAERRNLSNSILIVGENDGRDRLINEYDRESDDETEENLIVADTEDEEENDEEFVNRRAKMPRLHSNLDLKEECTSKEEPKKVEEPAVDEEVIYLI